MNSFPKNCRRILSRVRISMGLAFLISVSFLIVGQNGEAASSTRATGEVTYQIKLFEDGKAKYFQYKTDKGLTVKYFVLKSSDGVIRAAFDACDVCWPQGKGYFQKGDYMVCRNCGRRFASVNVNVITGGCNPAALTREVVGDKLVIKVKDILEGQKYFNFSK